MKNIFKQTSSEIRKMMIECTYKLVSTTQNAIDHKRMLNTHARSYRKHPTKNIAEKLLNVLNQTNATDKETFENFV